MLSLRGQCLALLLCIVCSVVSLSSAQAVPEHVVRADTTPATVQLAAPAYDDDDLAVYQLRPRIAIADGDSMPLLVIAALWAVFLAGLGIAHWRERKRSKVVE